jgi:uncharacterized protein (TIGR02145 family)
MGFGIGIGIGWPNASAGGGIVPPTVVIGDQTWTLKNLDVTTYADGTAIPQVTDPIEWAALTTGAWCYYNNDPANEAIYGKLYNWYAVNDSRGLAPTGYHVPTDAEWTTLTTYLGGLTVAGGKLKETGIVHWNTPNTAATNESLFTALPGGLRVDDGSFLIIDYYGYWWSSSELDAANAWYRTLGYNNGIAYRFNYYKTNGFSIRLIKN